MDKTTLPLRNEREALCEFLRLGAAWTRRRRLAGNETRTDGDALHPRLGVAPASRAPSKKTSRTTPLFPKTRGLLRSEALHPDPDDWGAEWREAWDELARAEDALRNWSECYPEDVFIPVTDEQQKAVVALLKENGYTPDALYAHWGRHIVKCLREEMGQ